MTEEISFAHNKNGEYCATEYNDLHTAQEPLDKFISFFRFLGSDVFRALILFLSLLFFVFIVGPLLPIKFEYFIPHGRTLILFLSLLLLVFIVGALLPIKSEDFIPHGH